jgi:hypothetical protein
MARFNPMFYLPLKKYYKRGNKTTILIIPGAQAMERGQLEEIIQWQEEKIDGEPVKPVAVIPKEEVKEMLLEFAAHTREKRRR